MNIVLFGDSHLGRFGKAPIAYFESLIDGAVVYNCSAGGFTSRDGVKRAEYIAASKPDIVIFSYGGNDVAPWKSIVPKDEYLENMQAILKAFPDSKKILFESPDVHVNDESQTVAYNSLVHEYRTALAPIATELGAITINGNAAVEVLGADHHEDDGVHLNEAAYKLVIQAFADVANNP